MCIRDRTWTHLPEAEAMKNAGELIRSYVLAGFSKIHIDTSMRLADDAPNERLSDVVIAHRGAQLCRIAEEAFAQYSAWHPEAPAPVYVIGLSLIHIFFVCGRIKRF